MKNDINNNERKFLLNIIAPQGKNLLEIGCGMGSQIEYLSKDTLQYIAIDQNQNAIGHLISKYKGDPRIKPSVGYGESLDFSSSTFDCAIMIMCFHEIPIQSQFLVLKEAKRVLKTNGHLVIADPAYPSSLFQSIFDFVHLDIRLFDHKIAVNHSRWVIEESIRKHYFNCSYKIDYDVDYSFDNQLDINKYVMNEFTGEVVWNFENSEKLDVRIDQILHENHIDSANPFVIRDNVTVYDLMVP